MEKAGWLCLGGSLILWSLGCGKTHEEEPEGDTWEASGGRPSNTGSGLSGGGSSDDPADDVIGSGGSPHKIPSAGVSTVAEFCDVFPAAMAAYNAECGGGSVDEWSLASPDCGAAVRSERAGRVALNVEQADACLHSITIGQCNDVSCSQVLTGTIPDGGPCNRLGTSLGDECELDLICPAAKSDACTSTCRPPDLLSEGERCDGMFNNATCPAPLQCNAEAICTVPSRQGETCRSVNDCAPGLYCAQADADTSGGGTCQPQAAGEGDTCTYDECIAGLFCRGKDSEKTCISPKRVGSSCTFGQNECAQQCSLEGLCEVGSTKGAPCGHVEDPETGESEYLECVSELYCEVESSTCQPRIAAGSSCAGIVALGQPCALSEDGFTECVMGVCQSCAWLED